MLTQGDLDDLTAFRRFLHQHPELSGEETETAAQITRALEPLKPHRILTGLGGHGVAAVFDSGRPGSTVLFRAELDALPIAEDASRGIDWISQNPGKGHLCGHDGHMTMLLGLARCLSRRPVQTGRVVLMFQPSEEDGRGARAVVADPAYASIRPDWAFAIHNEPGRPLGYVATRAGLINCASRGLEITLQGKTAHAADPQDGIAPTMALARCLPALTALSRGTERDDAFRLVTITHARLGEPTFGIAPGEATIHATLRTGHDTEMAGLMADAKAVIDEAAAADGLTLRYREHDVFAASINDTEAHAVACEAMRAIGIVHGDAGLPMRASEDFGVFGQGAKASMLCLGSGETHAALHNPDYDFPDELIPIGVSLFDRIARDLLGSAA
ncbi:amidohydrolase [Cognatishimia sp. F0-27]|uniref:amidohydrolase n=1 Tax=Cognatishimia sp. F0-27 TaxID=2816855 RepID=UPI001D0CA727|nr:amidohydrolase [Cognatishimia sp. F0-27]MCC1492033.1 amidohydrolase [Cognatishimia sp. F0-27]